MDPLQLVGIVAVSAGVGFLAASQKYVRQIRMMQSATFNAHAESVTRMTTAALQTITEDFKADMQDARTKLFARCAKLGMKLVSVDTQTGKQEVLANPSNTDEDHKS